MTKLVILTPHEQHRFDAPPIFKSDERSLYFALTNEEVKLINELRTPTNKIGFVLQLGYFKANAKFFTSEQFRPQDIEYVANMLGYVSTHINLSSYQKKIPTDHRKRILTLLGWQPLNKTQQEKIIEYVNWLAQRQIPPKNLFLSIIDYCWQNKIELPSYNTLAVYITNSYNYFEETAVNIVAAKVTQYHRDKLCELAGINLSKKQMQRSPLTVIKRMNQSLRPMDIQENVDACNMFKEYFNEFKPIINELQLPDSATEYFATWVQKSTVSQLNQFPNKNKLYLYLLCYIKHQFTSDMMH